VLLLLRTPVERSPAVAFDDLSTTTLVEDAEEVEEDGDGFVHEGCEEGACFRGGGNFFSCVGIFGAIDLLLLVLYAPAGRRPAVAFGAVWTIALLLGGSDEDEDDDKLDITLTSRMGERQVQVSALVASIFEWVW
jgi:hypothetical protein